MEPGTTKEEVTPDYTKLNAVMSKEHYSWKHQDKRHATLYCSDTDWTEHGPDGIPIVLVDYKWLGQWKKDCISWTEEKKYDHALATNYVKYVWIVYCKIFEDKFIGCYVTDWKTQQTYKLSVKQYQDALHRVRSNSY